MKPSLKYAIAIVDLVLAIYIFIIGINGLSEALSIILDDYISTTFLHTILYKLENPFFGLLVGIVGTAILQSSSTTSAIIIATVSSGVLSVRTALPIIIGTNFGTTITNTIVALFQRKKNQDSYEQALAASMLHDFYNLITLSIMFPLEITYHFIENMAFKIYGFYSGSSNLLGRFSNPLNSSIEYFTDIIKIITNDEPVWYTIVSLALIIGSLSMLVHLLKKIFLKSIKKELSQKLFATRFRSWASGVFSTMIIQSSSVTTSLVVPLAASKELTLEQIYPYTVGANIGTGLTAFIAAVSLNPIALIAALISLIYDVTATILVFINPLLSWLPVYLAKQFGYYGAKYKRLPLIYIVITFIVIPLFIMQLK